jgi:hypothetical protein
MLGLRSTRSALLVLTAPLLTMSARASADDAATAEALFQEGRKLMEAGLPTAACPKFLESQKLAPGVGTLLNLADCYEQTGQTATAWATFNQAIAAAQHAGRADREKTARERASQLERKLSKLNITVADKSEGLEVRRDGVVVERAAFGKPVPVDPGKHVVEATAPGKHKWMNAVDVDATTPLMLVRVPVLEAASEEPSPKPPREAPRDLGRDDKDKDTAKEDAKERPSDGSAQRVIGLAVSGVGVIGLAVGAALGLSARSKWSDAETNHCNNGPVCDQDGVNLVDSAKTMGNLATIFFVGGGIAAVAGLVVYLTAPSGSGPRRSGVFIAPALCGVRFGGAFE